MIPDVTVNTPLARKVKRVQKLAELAIDIANDMHRQGPLNLTKKQRGALYRVLRVLDLRNEYKVGDELRLAFGVELDGVGTRD
jgi:hypothetical protein